MKAIFYLPVKKKYTDLWEYYQADLEVLQELFDEVVVCRSVIDFFKEYHRAKLIYAWWWNRSLPVILICKILRIKVITTGAIHMLDLSGGRDFVNSSFLYKVAVRLSLRLSDCNLFISKDQYYAVTSHLRVQNPRLLYPCLKKNTNRDPAAIFQLKKVIQSKRNDPTIPLFATIVWHTPTQFQRKGVWETMRALANLKGCSAGPFRWTLS